MVDASSSFSSCVFRSLAQNETSWIFNPPGGRNLGNSACQRQTPRVFPLLGLSTTCAKVLRHSAISTHPPLRPSNYQSDGRRRPAAPSGNSSARDGRETAADGLLNVPSSINYFILHTERIHYLNHQSIPLSYYTKHLKNSKYGCEKFQRCLKLQKNSLWIAKFKLCNMELYNCWTR